MGGAPSPRLHCKHARFRPGTDPNDVLASKDLHRPPGLPVGRFFYPPPRAPSKPGASAAFRCSVNRRTGRGVLLLQGWMA